MTSTQTPESHRTARGSLTMLATPLTFAIPDNRKWETKTFASLPPGTTAVLVTGTVPASRDSEGTDASVIKIGVVDGSWDYKLSGEGLWVPPIPVRVIDRSIRAMGRGGGAYGYRTVTWHVVGYYD